MNSYRVIINRQDWGELDTTLANTRLTGVTEENFCCFEIAQHYILLKDGLLIEIVCSIPYNFDHEAKTLTYNGPVHVESNWVYKQSQLPLSDLDGCETGEAE